MEGALLSALSFVLSAQKKGIKKGRNTLAVFRPTSTYENNPFWKGYQY